MKKKFGLLAAIGMSVSLCCNSAFAQTNAANSPAASTRKATDFRIGIEIPSQTKIEPGLESALREMGINYINYYVNTSDAANSPDAPPDETNAAMMALADRLKLDFSISSHAIDPPEKTVRDAAARSNEGSRFLGVMVDELEHARLLNPTFSPKPFDTTKWKSLPEAQSGAISAYQKLGDKFKSWGAPAATATHIWPVLHDVSARAGWIVCPKICKELYSSVAFAIGMGAAKQHNRPLWADVDMWYYDMVPGHPPEEVRSNLLLAYWLGADLVYLEGSGYNLVPAGKQGVPFSLMHLTAPWSFQLTPHGEMLRAFTRDYLPKNPRNWTFRDVKPNIAIVRFEDSDHGQKFSNWPDHLFGSPHVRSDRDTQAWLQVWNLITFGKTGSNGITQFKAPQPSFGYGRPPQPVETASYLMRPMQTQSHTFFVPLNGAIVYNHLVGYDLLQDVPLLFVTGKYVSDETVAAVKRSVQEGAKCVVWSPLAKRFGLSEAKDGVKISDSDKGRFIVTDDFGFGDVYKEIVTLLGRPDEIRYRFGDNSVVLRRVTDNEVNVEIERAAAK